MQLVAKIFPKRRKAHYEQKTKDNIQLPNRTWICGDLSDSNYIELYYDGNFQ